MSALPTCELIWPSRSCNIHIRVTHARHEDLSTDISGTCTGYTRDSPTWNTSKYAFKPSHCEVFFSVPECWEGISQCCLWPGVQQTKVPVVLWLWSACTSARPPTCNQVLEHRELASIIFVQLHANVGKCPVFHTVLWWNYLKWVGYLYLKPNVRHAASPVFVLLLHSRWYCKWTPFSMCFCLQTHVHACVCIPGTAQC